MNDQVTSEWRSDFENCPFNEPVWVAFHGRGENQAQIVTRTNQMLGRHGGWDYINSHNGQPKYWQPLTVPVPPENMAGPDCECDDCMEQFAEEEPQP